VNLAETHDLLTLIATFDNRRFDDAVVVCWQEILGSLTFDDARQAVFQHFGDTAEWLMPAHVKRIVAEIDRDRRRVRREHLEQAALASEAADPTRRDRSAEVQALLDDLRERLGPGKPNALRRPEWVEVDRQREREARAEPNPAFTGVPPEDGWPIPEEPL